MKIITNIHIKTTAVLLAVIFMLVYLPIPAVAQVPEEEWNKVFGGIEDETGDAVLQTSDGGYIIAGSTKSSGPGLMNTLLIKTDSSGIQQWEQTYGEAGWYYWPGSTVLQTSDDGYVIAGSKQQGSSTLNAWLIKTDSNGVKQWEQTLGGSSVDRASSVQQTSDGGYIITGSTGTGGVDVWLIKVDSSGIQQWEKTFGGTGEDTGESILQTSDGGYIIAGYTKSYGAGGYDVWLIKTDSAGNYLWDRTFGGAKTDFGYLVQHSLDNGYIITGYTRSSKGTDVDAEVWLIKTDIDGNKEWDKTFGGSDDDIGLSVEQTDYGAYLIAGCTESYGGGQRDYWLIKTDSRGNKLWEKLFGGSGDDTCSAVQQTSDGGCILVGTSDSQEHDNDLVWLIKVKASTNIPPDQPETVYPTAMMEDVELTAALASSAFSDEDGDTHAASHWQITTTSGDYSSPVYDSGRDTAYLVGIAVPAGKLTYSTTYYYRVRYEDGLGNWSDWSTEKSFTTKSEVASTSAAGTSGDDEEEDNFILLAAIGAGLLAVIFFVFIIGILIGRWWGRRGR